MPLKAILKLNIKNEVNIKNINGEINFGVWSKWHTLRYWLNHEGIHSTKLKDNEIKYAH